MSAGTAIKPWHERVDTDFTDGMSHEDIAARDAEIAELRMALEAAEQNIPPRLGESPCIEDRDGIPAAIRMVIQSRGSIGSLRGLYRLINVWGAEQRADAIRKQPDSGRDAALEKFFTALAHIDFRQFAMHRNPCWRIEEDGSFCGRDKAWAGHQSGWKYVSLKDAVDAMATQQGDTVG